MGVRSFLFLKNSFLGYKKTGCALLYSRFLVLHTDHEGRHNIKRNVPKNPERRKSRANAFDARWFKRHFISRCSKTHSGYGNFWEKCFECFEGARQVPFVRDHDKVCCVELVENGFCFCGLVIAVGNMRDDPNARWINMHVCEQTKLKRHFGFPSVIRR